MPIMLPLDEMSVREKLDVLELIWADLAKREQAIDSPEWHGPILRAREQAILDGTDEFVDLETARAEYFRKRRR